MNQDTAASGEPTLKRERELNRLAALRKLQPETDDLAGSGVLFRDSIEHYVEKYKLISPFEQTNLSPACYKLRVGDECAVGGEIQRLSELSGTNEIVIPPFEVAVIKTYETLNVPRFLIGRWNIQVSKAYVGLLWVGGPQVDAGYVGHLFCPIYNLSNQKVVLRLGEKFAVIDFVKTTPGKGDAFGFPPKRVLIEDYKPEMLRSALAVLTTERLSTIENQITTLEKRMNTFITVTLTAIGVLFAVLAFFVTVGDPKALPLWAFTSVLFSAVAFLTAVGALNKWWRP